MKDIATTALPSGEAVPVLGQGTWRMGEDAGARRREVDALRLGLDLGMTLIDTAEMYAEGEAERVAGEAIAGRRDEVFLVGKVLPSNARRAGTVAACEASLRRLGTDRLDLYLLHWPAATPLVETIAGFEALRDAGKIRHWGVSNFDAAEMGALADFPGGQAVATNQVLYNLARRGPEFDLLPFCRARGLPLMAYSPVEQGRMLRHAGLKAVAASIGATPVQVALAWLIGRGEVIAIPKAASAAHLRENRAALDINLDEATLAALDEAFPPPRGPRPLDML